jgi:hypothetical protein
MATNRSGFGWDGHLKDYGPRLIKNEQKLCSDCKQVITTKTKGLLHKSHTTRCGSCYLKMKARERRTQGLR